MFFISAMKCGCSAFFTSFVRWSALGLVLIASICAHTWRAYICLDELWLQNSCVVVSERLNCLSITSIDFNRWSQIHATDAIAIHIDNADTRPTADIRMYGTTLQHTDRIIPNSISLLLLIHRNPIFGRELHKIDWHFRWRCWHCWWCCGCWIAIVIRATMWETTVCSSYKIYKSIGNCISLAWSSWDFCLMLTSSVHIVYTYYEARRCPYAIFLSTAIMRMSKTWCDL